MRATIKDVAKSVGLSITTVSLILNNKIEKFPQETIDLVINAAEKLNYRQNQLSIGLLKKKTHTLGLIIPDISNTFFSELAKAIEDRSRQDNYNIFLCNSNDEFLVEKQCLCILADRSVDGIILIMSAETYGEKGDECLALLRSLDIPAVLVDCFNMISDFSTISVDNYSGSRMAVQYLLDLGHRKIACVTGPLGITTNKERLRGYTEGLLEMNIEPDNSFIYEGDFRYQSGYDSVKKLLTHNPTAIFCHNDMMAYGAIKALKDKGYKVPLDISVVGFDDIFFSEYMDIPLTTVRQPVYDMGFCAASILIDEVLHTKKQSKHILLEPHMALRQSAAELRHGIT